MGPFIIHKERFLAAGTHFFRAGGLRGGPRKNIYFLGYQKFSGAPKLPLNEKNIKQTSFRAFLGGPLSPPARKKCVPAARNPSLWMIKGPIIYLPIFFFV